MRIAIAFFFFSPFLGVLILLFAGGEGKETVREEDSLGTRKERGDKGKNKNKNTPGKKPGRRKYMYFLPMANYFNWRYIISFRERWYCQKEEKDSILGP